MDNSSHKALHIISFDIPYPADYGGVIDVYYKLKSLAALGVEITLHCFQYGKRLPQPHLETLCRKVYYYPRLTGWKGLHTSLPYIVSSRRDETLFSRLLEDDAPILFEGLHTTFYAAHVLLAGRIKLPPQ